MLIRLTLWLWATSYLVGLASSQDLKILFRYSLGLPWMEEYYYFYLCLCFFTSVGLVGFPSWRDFFFKELGFEGLTYLVVVPTSVSQPESYQPNRAGWKAYQKLIHFDLQYGEKTYEEQDPYSNRYISSEYPNRLVTQDDPRLVAAQMQEFGFNPWLVLEQYILPDQVETTLIDDRYTYNLSRIHPGYLRNEWPRPPGRGWEKIWLFYHQLLEEDKWRYQTPDSGNQYWNRTIIHRTQTPQSYVFSSRPPPN